MSLFKYIGNHGRNDFDDWRYLDVSWFESKPGAAQSP